MYSPFQDEQGRPKTLEEVTWDDLSQLADLEEGFALEFKQTFGPSVRRKIPKIIASFSNSRGGWLVIGIADDTRAVTPVPKGTADFSQVIGELCRRHVSPAPRFDVRFIPDPRNSDQGVAIVRVDEGDFPPYVADGIVEIREGSSSGPAAGTALVDLYDRATARKLDVRRFCERTVYYPMTEGVDDPLPLFDLYLFKLGPRSDEVGTRAKINECATAMRKAFKRQGLGCRVQHAHDSLVFRTAQRDETIVPHSAIELFPDESMKLSVPAVILTGDDLDHAIKVLSERTLFPPRADARLIDASATLRRVTRMASLLDRYVRIRRLSWREYAVAYELENMAGVMLWSADETYLNYAAKNGVLYCATTDCLSRVRYLDDGSHDTFRARQFAGSHFFEACGLPLGSQDPEDNELVNALLSTSDEK
ncbi:MAG: ATP-binding protein [Tractidigestivibacter sp.]|uniref:ATP-binding protein n=1 Tax=Tractidigestivibacter sp. TaxID=2847320 RepID=UPI003D8D6FDA